MSSVIKTIEGTNCTLQLNRPDKLNALNREMYELLTSGLEEASADNNIKTIVLKGTEGIFTAGNDLADFAAAVKQGGTFDAPFSLMNAMLTYEKCMIASVDGPAIGIGATLLFHCDLVYASDNAKLQTPFTDLGVCPEFASSVTFPALLGSHKAAQMLLLGEPLMADEALRFGLVNQLVDSGSLDETVNAVVGKLSTKPDDSLRTSRSLLRALNKDYQKVIDREATEFGRLMSSEKFMQKLDAFLNKKSKK